MATTHSGNRTRMPDLSASLNDNTSCSPLSDLWNIPKSKLFPSAGTATTAATATSATFPPSSLPQTPATIASGGSSTSDSPATTAAIGQIPSDLKLGGSSSANTHSASFGTSLWNRHDVLASGHTPPKDSAISQSNGASGVPSGVPPQDVAAPTAPVAAGSVGPVGAVGAPMMPLAPGSVPGSGSPTYRNQSRSATTPTVGIWGNEYPNFRHPHHSSHSVGSFSQPPSSSGRMGGPFLTTTSSGTISGPVRALDTPTTPSVVAASSAPLAGTPLSQPLAQQRPLDASWERPAFKQSPGLPAHHAGMAPASAQASVSQSPQVGPVAGQVPQFTAQQHAQQQAQNAHRAQKKGTRPSTNTELYKTELCASYMSTGGNCPYGEKCQFAHGTQELKTVDRPPKWRSKPCQNWVKTGTCSYNERCCFRHDIPVAPQ